MFGIMIQQYFRFGSSKLQNRKKLPIDSLFSVLLNLVGQNWQIVYRNNVSKSFETYHAYSDVFPSNSQNIPYIGLCDILWPFLQNYISCIYIPATTIIDDPTHAWPLLWTA